MEIPAVSLGDGWEGKSFGMTLTLQVVLTKNMMIIPKSCFVSNNMSNVNVMYHSVKLNIQAKLETSWVLVDEKNGRPLQRMKDSAETVPLLAHTSHTLKGIMVFIVQTTKKCSNVISIGLILIISSMSS